MANGDPESTELKQRPVSEKTALAASPTPDQVQVSPLLWPRFHSQVGLSQLKAPAKCPLPHLHPEPPPVPHALLLPRVPTIQPPGSHTASVPKRVCTSEEAKLHHKDRFSW